MHDTNILGSHTTFFVFLFQRYLFIYSFHELFKYSMYVLRYLFIVSYNKVLRNIRYAIFADIVSAGGTVDIVVCCSSVSMVSTVDSVEWVRVHRDADERQNTTTRPQRNAYSFIPHTIHRAVSANLPLFGWLLHMHTTAQATLKCVTSATYPQFFRGFSKHKCISSWLYKVL